MDRPTTLAMLATGVTTAVMPNLQDKSFRFKDLPRELRDMVYELCTVDDVEIDIKAVNSVGKRVEHDEKAFRAFVDGTQVASLMVADRQINAEYKKSLVRGSTLRVRDDGESEIADRIMISQKAHVLRNIGRVRASIMIDCESCQEGDQHPLAACTVRLYADCHSAWLEDLMQACGPGTSCGLKLYITKTAVETGATWPDYSTMGSTLVQAVDSLQSIPGMTEAEVLYSDSNSISREKPTAEVWGMWTKTAGWKKGEDTDK